MCRFTRIVTSKVLPKRLQSGKDHLTLHHPLLHHGALVEKGALCRDCKSGKLADNNVADKPLDKDAAPPVGRDNTTVSHGMKAHQREASTLTDVCCDENIPEVEIFSLLEEKIPRYALRAETIEDFYGNSDWIQTPLIPSDLDLDLTPDLIEATLQYFTICSERVTQMTKTFNDIEAVTRLLEEKERDLELAARIGQTLLDRNKALSEKNDQLEAEVTDCHEKIRQLKHELTLKDDLLQVYTREEFAESEDGSPISDSKHRFNQTLVNLDSLQRKVHLLEEENLKYASETAQLNLDTIDYEEKEEQLVKDLIKQLAENNETVKYLSEELGSKSDVNLQQQEEITNLLGKNVLLDNKVKKLSAEKQELQSHLVAAQEAQKELATEIDELHNKYAECTALLHAANEEIKMLRRKHRPAVARQLYSSFSPFLPADSLASELENEFRKDVEFPPGESPDERRSHTSRVLETVKAVNKSHRQHSSTRNSITSLQTSASFQSTTSGNETCDSTATPSNRSSLYLSEGESFDGYRADTDSTYGSCTNLGRPGIPGSNDLETALRRLSLRRANEISERNYYEEEQRKRNEGDGTATPTPCRTPDSMLSTGSALSDFSRLSGISGYNFRMPQKLQIVKPIEGSATLLQWQRLATPHMGGILDPRPGVFNKGAREIDMEDEVYNLSDYEEDDLCEARQFQETTSTFTLTQAKVLHPAECVPSARVPSGQASSQVTATLTDQAAQNSSTKTYSMSMSLATSLNERDTDPSSQPNGLNQLLSPSNPVRFHSITTETMSESMRSSTEAIYTSATSFLGDSGQGITTQSGSMFAGVDLSAINIVDKIKNLTISRTGLANLASILPLSQNNDESKTSPSRSRTSTPRLSRKIYNTDQVGLNVIRGFGNDKKSPVTSSQGMTSDLSGSTDSLSSLSTLSVKSFNESPVAQQSDGSPDTSGLNGILALTGKPRRIKPSPSAPKSHKKEQKLPNQKPSVRTNVITAGSHPKPLSFKSHANQSGLNSILGLSASAKVAELPGQTYTCGTCTGSARVALTNTVSSLSTSARLSPSVINSTPASHKKGSLTDCLKTPSPGKIRTG